MKKIMCLHHSYEQIGLDITRGMKIANMGNYSPPIEIVEPVCMCDSCGVLFVPRKEKHYRRTDK